MTPSIAYGFDSDYNGPFFKMLMEYDGLIKFPSSYVKEVTVEYTDGELIDFVGFTSPFIRANGLDNRQFMECGKDIETVFVLLDHEKMAYMISRKVNKLFEGKLSNV